MITVRSTHGARVPELLNTPRRLMMRRLTLAVLAGIACIQPHVAAAFDTSDYASTAFADIETRVRAADWFPKSEATEIFDVQLPKYSSSVELTGASRPIDTAELRYLKDFFVAFGQPDAAQLFKTEVQVSENGAQCDRSATPCRPPLPTSLPWSRCSPSRQIRRERPHFGW